MNSLLLRWLLSLMMPSVLKIQSPIVVPGNVVKPSLEKRIEAQQKQFEHLKEQCLNAFYDKLNGNNHHNNLSIAPVWDLIHFFQQNKISLDTPIECQIRILDDVTLLMMACVWGDEEMIDHLLDAGASPNCCNKNNGFTPLHYFVFYLPRRFYPTMVLPSWDGFSFNCVEKLLRYGADPNKASIAGFTPLIIAAEFGCVDAVELLLKYNADSSVKFQDCSIIEYCMRKERDRNQYDCIKLLYAAGARAGSKKIELFHLVLNYKDHEFLYELCFSESAVFKRNLLWHAAEFSSLRCLMVLADNSSLCTPYILLKVLKDNNCDCSREKIVYLLNKIPVEILNGSGLDFIQTAAKYGNESAIVYLIGSGIARKSIISYASPANSVALSNFRVAAINKAFNDITSVMHYKKVNLSFIPLVYVVCQAQCYQQLDAINVKDVDLYRAILIALDLGKDRNLKELLRRCDVAGKSIKQDLIDVCLTRPYLTVFGNNRLRRLLFEDGYRVCLYKECKSAHFIDCSFI